MVQILACQVYGGGAVSRESELLRSRLDGLDVAYDASAPERLAAYHAMLTEWNERVNLTGDADFDVMLDRHYIDSVAALRHGALYPNGASLADVGSGAGFPGLPLAIVRPDLRVTLIDSLGKRVKFLDAVVAELGLPNVVAMHARAEDAAHDPKLRERFDIATARAVAATPVLLEYLLPFVRVGGHAICYKGPSESANDANGAARLLGGGEVRSLDAPMPSQPEWRHCLLVCEKLQKTVRQYPRKAGTPAKEPLS